MTDSGRWPSRARATAPRPMTGALSGVPGRSPAESSSITSSESPGSSSTGVAQQLEHGAGRDASCRSRAPRSSRRARSGRRPRGTRYAARHPQHAGQQTRARWVAQAHDLALDRAGAGPRLLGEPASSPDHDAGGDHHGVRSGSARRRQAHTGDATRSVTMPLTSVPRSRSSPPAAPDRVRKRRGQLARIDRVVVGDLERAAGSSAPARARGGGPRSGAAASPRARSARRICSSRSSASASSRSRAAISVPHAEIARVAARSLARARPRTPGYEPARRDPQPQQRLLAWIGLGYRGEHPGGDVRGAAARARRARARRTRGTLAAASRHATASPITPPPIDDHDRAGC